MMDRRCEPRIPVNGKVLVRVLGGDSAFSIPASMRNFSGQGMNLEVYEPVPIGAAVEIELGDQLWLGEVCRTHTSAAGSYIGVRLRQAVPSMSGLARLVSAVMGESVRDIEKAGPAARRSRS